MLQSTTVFAFQDVVDLPPLEPLIASIDHVELYTRNVQQTARYYEDALGFTPVAIRNGDVSAHEELSIALVQGNIRLLVSGRPDPEGETAKNLAQYGDGIRDIAFHVYDVGEVFDRAVQFGARPLSQPIITKDEYGLVLSACVSGCGNLVHSLVQRCSYYGAFLPGYRSLDSRPVPRVGLTGIDDLAISVPAGGLEESCEFYQHVFGFKEDMSTGCDAQTSRVVRNSTGTVALSLSSPGDGRTIDGGCQRWQRPGRMALGLAVGRSC